MQVTFKSLPSIAMACWIVVGVFCNWPDYSVGYSLRPVKHRAGPNFNGAGHLVPWFGWPLKSYRWPRWEDRKYANAEFLPSYFAINAILVALASLSVFSLVSRSSRQFTSFHVLILLTWFAVLFSLPRIVSYGYWTYSLLVFVYFSPLALEVSRRLTYTERSRLEEDKTEKE